MTADFSECKIAVFKVVLKNNRLTHRKAFRTVKELAGCSYTRYIIINTPEYKVAVCLVVLFEYIRYLAYPVNYPLSKANG